MDNVEKIKERLNIVDVVGAYIKLEKAGSNLRARCPFHNEKTPSFFVSPDRGTYKCFGCGEGGDIFSFVEKFESVDFKGALKILADKAGVKLRKENPKITDERNKIYSVLESATAFFEKNLKENKSALEYLKKRGLTERIIKQFRLGFAKEAWRDLREFLKQNAYSDIEMEKAGLIKKSEQKNEFYDRFRNRIIFPIFDNSNRPIAFSGRLFDKNSGLASNIATQYEQVPNTATQYEQAKYLNSPETILFSKSNILYGYNFAKSQIRKKDFSILVEGQMDLLMCHQVGYDNAVASSGTAFGNKHADLLKRLSNKVAIAFDGDTAGFLSACKAAKIVLAEGMETRLMEIPEGMDPAELIFRDKKRWQKSLKNAKHIVDFYLNKLIAETEVGSSRLRSSEVKRKLGRKVQEKVLPLVALVSSEIEKANFVEDIAAKLDIAPQAVWVELAKLKEGDLFGYKIGMPKIKLAEELSAESKKNRKQLILRQISGIYWWQKNAEKPVLRLAKLEKEIKTTAGVEIFEKIENLREKIKDEIIFEAEILYENTENIKEKIEELFKNLKIELLEGEIKKIVKEQEKAEKEGNTKEALKKLKIYDKLSKQRNLLIS